MYVKVYVIFGEFDAHQIIIDLFLGSFVPLLWNDNLLEAQSYVHL